MQDGDGTKKIEAADDKKRISGEWKKYGRLMVKTTFGKASITDLMILYAERAASLKY